MIDVIDTAVQIVVLLICLAISMYFIVKTKEKSWVLMHLYYLSYLLGNLYWQAVAFYYGATPEISVVSDLSWYASYIFLCLFLFMECEKHLGKDFNSKAKCTGIKRIIPFLPIPFVSGMALLYMKYGKIVSNVIYAILMAVLLYNAIRNILCFNDRYIRYISFVVILNCLAEYGSWTFSFYYYDISTWANPYYWFNALIAVIFLIYLIVKKREVAR
ncbi:MAG: hypothetical protein IKO84_12835 [Butyrivibrio sp.]|nr:hypothetical protein [Butyrivibrio sp.]